MIQTIFVRERIGWSADVYLGGCWSILEGLKELSPVVVAPEGGLPAAGAVNNDSRDLLFKPMDHGVEVATTLLLSGLEELGHKRPDLLSFPVTKEVGSAATEGLGLSCGMAHRLHGVIAWCWAGIHARGGGDAFRSRPHRGQEPAEEAHRGTLAATRFRDHSGLFSSEAGGPDVASDGELEWDVFSYPLRDLGLCA